MSTKTTEHVKSIKPLLNFNKLADTDLLKRLDAIRDGMTGNGAFPTPPVDMATFKAAVASYDTLTTNALDGGKKAISAKKKQRKVVIRMAMELGHYVWAASHDDLATFNTSGFEVAQNTKAPAQPLSKAAIQYVDRGPTSGKVVLKPKPLKGTVSWELHYAVVPPGSTTPAAPAGGTAAATTAGTAPALVSGPWTSVMLPGSKAVTINNLIPGTTYQFQVRGLGQLGYSDWSDPVNFICT